MITLNMDDNQVQILLSLIDAAVKAQGVQAVQAAAVIITMVQTANEIANAKAEDEVKNVKLEIKE